MKKLFVGCAVLAALFVAPPDAQAASPGANDLIAFESEGRIWTRNADGSGRTARSTPTGNAVDSDPAWSQDGNRLAFVRTEGTSSQVWTAAPDGANAEQLTHFGPNVKVTSPTWSPDGTRIAVSMAPRQNDTEVVLINSTNGIAVKELTNDGGTAPSWSPSGHAVAFIAPEGHVMALRPAIGGGFSVGDPGSSSPDWAPNSRILGWIASNKTVVYQPWAFDGARTELGVTAVDGMSFSPDGARIAYGCGVGDRVHLCTVGVNALDVIDHTGSGPDERDPAWRPTPSTHGRLSASRTQAIPGDAVRVTPETKCAPGAQIALRLVDAHGATLAAAEGTTDSAGGWRGDLTFPRIHPAGDTYVLASCGSLRYAPHAILLGPPPLPRTQVVTAGGGELANHDQTSRGPLAFGRGTPLPGYTGALSVARGDVDTASDGDEYVVGVAPAQVLVLSQHFQLLRSFKPYGDAFGGGVNVAVGNVAGDSAVEIVTGAGAGGGPHVRVFGGDGAPVGGGFYAYDPAFGGGVNVAVGNLDGAGASEIVTGAGAGGGPHVRSFTAAGELANGNGFFAYDPGFSGGVSVGTGRSENGAAFLVTGAGAGGGPHVKTFRGSDGLPLASFFAYNPGFTGGVSVAAGDVDGLAGDEIVTGAGPGGGPHVQRFFSDGRAVDGGYMALAESFRGGVRVATGRTVVRLVVD